MKKKTLLIILAVGMILAGAIGTTLAWLTDSTTPITNTFTTSGIEIDLDESDDLDLQMVPGYTLTKDPVVTVLKGSEKSWLFVKLEKSENFDDFLTYDMAEGWTQGLGTDGIPTDVWYRGPVDASAADVEFAILDGNKVLVKDTVTAAALEALTEATNPTLTITAYASQFMKDNSNNFTPAEAWAVLNPTPTP